MQCNFTRFVVVVAARFVANSLLSRSDGIGYLRECGESFERVRNGRFCGSVEVTKGLRTL